MNENIFLVYIKLLDYFVLTLVAWEGQGRWLHCVSEKKFDTAGLVEVETVLTICSCCNFSVLELDTLNYYPTVQDALLK